MERLQLIKNYGFNRELAFKEIQIDPFVEEANNTLNTASVHCKSLSLHFSWVYGDDRLSYFIFPIFENFYNLNKLTLDRCEIQFTKFSNLLTKLEYLKELEMKFDNLILSQTEALSLSPNLQFPKSLTKLTYQVIKLGITDFPETKPLQFIRNTKRGYYQKDLNLLPQYLPNLKLFKYFNESWNVREFEKFLDMCPALEYVKRLDRY